MGSVFPEARADEQPVHEVELSPFAIGRYEVTNADYAEFIEAGGYEKRAFWDAEGWAYIQRHRIREPKFWDDEDFGRMHPDRPVVGITWWEAMAFARFKGLRLPTEAEWEYAAAGPEGRLYPWGNSLLDGSQGNFCDLLCPITSYRSTMRDGWPYAAPVGTFTAGKTPQGIYELAGNVNEWVSDRYQPDYYARSPRKDPSGPRSGADRVIRGGGWNTPPRELRSSARLHAPPSTQDFGTGFRLARTEPQETPTPTTNEHS
jgi:formylglycine-generating enzyme required for sulfatase activity